MTIMEDVLNRVSSKALIATSRLLSLREAAVLADVPETCVRKDIDAGIVSFSNLISIVGSHKRFDWSSVVVMAAVYGNELLRESKPLREAAVLKVFSATTIASRLNCLSGAPVLLGMCRDTTVDLDKFLVIPLGRVCESVRPRVGLYADGLDRVEEKDSILGGAAVFKNRRLPVHHVAKLVEDGESMEHILEDYPYLTRDDVDFACLYSHARPIVGRPRASGVMNNEPVDA